MSTFEIRGRCPRSHARLGRLALPHAAVDTPVFMPVGTQGSVKTMTPQEVDAMGYRLILGNTYHLHLRPGETLIAQMGGLHRFIHWPHAILTDSGGYQVFSLKEITRITEEGVVFKSWLDGRKIELTPERATDIQLALGSDIVMAFDECIPYPSEEAYVREATRRSFRWTRRSCERFRERSAGAGQLFFGIVQGGMYPQLRDESMELVSGLAADGLAIGGLSVREPKPVMREILTHVAPRLDPARPRYLMGVGTPRDIVEGVMAGVDMFDCVIPTRLGRHAHVFTHEGKLNLLNARHARDDTALDPGCSCATCRGGFSRAYLHHLFKAGEALGPRLATHHNLAWYQQLMVRIRQAIPAGRLPDLLTSLA